MKHRSLAVIALLAFTLAATVDAEAGTPDRGRVWRCGDPLRTKPQLCAEFYNTAGQGQFWIDATANGVRFPLGMNVTERPSRQKHPHVRIDVVVKDLAYDTDYCLRFRTVDLEGMISERWSAWSCARTAPRPLPPAPPTDVRAWYLPGKPDSRQTGKVIPDRVLLKWNAGHAYVASQNVEAVLPASVAQRPPAVERIPHASGEFQTVLSLRQRRADNQYGYRVCSINVVGKSCSAPVYAIASVPKAPGAQLAARAQAYHPKDPDR